jgi:hypothetical protein
LTTPWPANTDIENMATTIISHPQWRFTARTSTHPVSTTMYPSTTPTFFVPQTHQSIVIITAYAHRYHQPKPRLSSKRTIYTHALPFLSLSVVSPVSSHFIHRARYPLRKRACCYQNQKSMHYQSEYMHLPGYNQRFQSIRRYSPLRTAAYYYCRVQVLWTTI